MMNKKPIHNENKCLVCNSKNLTLFIEILSVPVHCNLLWPERDEAIGAPKGDIRLAFCTACGYIFNIDFDPGLMAYDQAYENSLHFSPRFQSYAESLAEDLVERYHLHNKHIIEIGCGNGEFLSLLCGLGENQGVGFDPSYIPGQANNNSDERITIVQDFYSEQYANYKADFICCRHVLEHIRFPHDFLARLRRAIGKRPDTVVFFEVPNVGFSLRHSGIWDLIYEHCSYFSIGSLARLFSSCGFQVQNCTEAYQSQFLCLEALPYTNGKNSTEGYSNEIKTMGHEVASFSESYLKMVESWRVKLDKIKSLGQRAVIWGSGSKGVTFLNVLRTQNLIEYAVDINPHKTGKYVAGTGQKIMPPEFLPTYRPDIIIVMNPIYLDEIRQQVVQMKLSCELVPV